MQCLASSRVDIGHKTCDKSMTLFPLAEGNTLLELGFVSTMAFRIERDVNLLHLMAIKLCLWCIKIT